MCVPKRKTKNQPPTFKLNGWCFKQIIKAWIITVSCTYVGVYFLKNIEECADIKYYMYCLYYLYFLYTYYLVSIQFYIIKSPTTKMFSHSAMLTGSKIINVGPATQCWPLTSELIHIRDFPVVSVMSNCGTPLGNNCFRLLCWHFYWFSVNMCYIGPSNYKESLVGPAALRQQFDPRVQHNTCWPQTQSINV